MKTSKKTFLIAGAAILTFAFVSWERTNNAQKESNANVYAKIFASNTMDLPWVNSSELSAFIADDGEYGNVRGADRRPAAEDVLVQKIPGDNYHLLIMAVYSFENYSGQFVTVDNNGTDLVLRDDGKEFDKIAGDGIFTAKIFADVENFRKTAFAINKQVQKNGPQVLFSNREITSLQNCSFGTFDEKMLDGNQATSIANLIGGSNNLIDSVRANCIFITELPVVEDPSRTWNPCSQTGNLDGPWTFKTMMKNLTQTSETPPTDIEISDFVLTWLHTWESPRIINGDTVPARPLITDKVINPWLAKSLAAGSPDGVLDMHFAPFKLTAIVNRFDIRERAAGIPAGEGRYTFCLIDSSCTQSEQMTIVMEFPIPKSANCAVLQDWATQWFNLKDLTLGSPEYNTALQAITDQYSIWGTGRGGGIGLDALRTNEIAFAAEDGNQHYEFREFNLSDNPRRLQPRPVSQIPADKYNVQVDNPDVRSMVAWINANKRGINNDSYTVPDSLSGVPFLGGHAQILDIPVGNPTQPYHWDGVQTKNSVARIKNTTTRHIFSRNTCTGCHAGEVQTFFTHVDPVFFGTQTTLSGFLMGKAGRGGAIDADNNPDNDSMMVRDAAGRGGANNSLRMFNDILRRAKDLKDFVTTPPCQINAVFAVRNELMFQPISGVH